MSVLPDKISTFQYYVNKLPLYLQQSNTFQEHFRIWYDLLVGHSSDTGVKGVCDTILSLLNIFDDQYSTSIADDMLDKIGALFGVRRNLTVTYGSPAVTKYISLSNRDFIIYIKFQIIKNACEGTREQIDEFYKSTGLIIYTINDSVSGNVNLHLNVQESNISQNIRDLFLAGELVLKSMGINYSYATTNMNLLLIWQGDTPTEGVVYNTWAKGRWVL